ncbi:MAG: LAGLIDADG family homing endonuclease, partial [Candidatus Micrarchaeota archaeon]
MADFESFIFDLKSEGDDRIAVAVIGANGKKRIEESRFQPYFYFIPESAAATKKVRELPQVKKVEDAEKIDDGKKIKCLKISVDSPASVIQLRSDLKEMGEVREADIPYCLHPDSYVQMSDGSIKKISEVGLSKVISIDINSNLEQKSSLCYDVIPSKSDIILEMITQRRRIKATPWHRFFVCKNGIVHEKRLGDIKKGDFVLISKKIGIKGSKQKLPVIMTPNIVVTKKGRAFLRGLREKNGCKLYNLPKNTGISYGTLHRIENYGQPVRKDNIMKLLEYYGKHCEIKNENYFKDSYSQIKKVKIPVYTNKKLCQLLGYAIGDGSIIHERGAHSSNLELADEDKKLLLFYNNLFNKIFNVKGTITKYSNHCKLTISSKQICSLLRSLSMDQLSKTRGVPEI